MCGAGSRYLSPNRHYFNRSVVNFFTCLGINTFHANIRNVVHQSILESYLSVWVRIGFDLVQGQGCGRYSLKCGEVLSWTHCLRIQLLLVLGANCKVVKLFVAWTFRATGYLCKGKLRCRGVQKLIV